MPAGLTRDLTVSRTPAEPRWMNHRERRDQRGRPSTREGPRAAAWLVRGPSCSRKSKVGHMPRPRGLVSGGSGQGPSILGPETCGCSVGAAARRCSEPNNWRHGHGTLPFITTPGRQTATQTLLQAEGRGTGLPVRRRALGAQGRLRGWQRQCGLFGTTMVSRN